MELVREATREIVQMKWDTNIWVPGQRFGSIAPSQIHSVAVSSGDSIGYVCPRHVTTGKIASLSGRNVSP